jgi:hypothetical protein
MSREDDVYTTLAATDLVSLYLTGGLYKSGDLGKDGITRDSVPAAFDSNGYLLPCGLIRQRDTVPDGIVLDYEVKTQSRIEVIEIYLYQDSGYDVIDDAKRYIALQLMGTMYADSFEMGLINIIERLRDQGALAGKSLERMDWSIPSILTE